MKAKKRKKKKRKKKRSQASQGMETTLSMDFVWITWNFKALYG